MARDATIREALSKISSCFPTFKTNGQLTSIVFDELFEVSDDTVTCAVRHLIVTESYPPKVADIVGAVKREAAYEAGRTAKRDTTYTEYSDRSPKDRAEIDEARAEFHRVWTALSMGTPVSDLFPYDSEPCRFGREMAAKMGGETPKATIVARDVLQMPPDYKAAASGERDEPEYGLDW
jgi:hypothetical protein